MARIMRFIGLVLIAAAAAGCSLWGEDSDPTSDWPARRLYDTAKGHLERGDYVQAIEHYEKLEVRYPFGLLAMQGQLDLIYAYYKSDEQGSTISAADRFIKLHPRHPNVDYAYYLKGLAQFADGDSLVGRFFRRDRAKHDASAALQSFRAFEELVQRFPESRYAEDSRQRMLYLKNVVAMHEIHVARYYMTRGAWLAAANRARYVVENYQRTPAVSEALDIMITAYRQMGLDDLAADADRVLRLNHPDDARSGEPGPSTP